MFWCPPPYTHPAKSICVLGLDVEQQGVEMVTLFLQHSYQQCRLTSSGKKQGKGSYIVHGNCKGWPTSGRGGECQSLPELSVR